MTRTLSSQRFASSFDPDERNRPRQSDAVEAGALNQYQRFTRMPNASQRWEQNPAIRKRWTDDFAAGLDAYRAAGGRI